MYVTLDSENQNKSTIKNGESWETRHQLPLSSGWASGLYKHTNHFKQTLHCTAQQSIMAFWKLPHIWTNCRTWLNRELLLLFCTCENWLVARSVCNWRQMRAAEGSHFFSHHPSSSTIHTVHFNLHSPQSDVFSVNAARCMPCSILFRLLLLLYVDVATVDWEACVYSHRCCLLLFLFLPMLVMPINSFWRKVRFYNRLGGERQLLNARARVSWLIRLKNHSKKLQDVRILPQCIEHKWKKKKEWNRRCFAILICKGEANRK